MPGPVTLRYRYKDEAPPLDRERHVLPSAGDVLILGFKAVAEPGKAVRLLAGKLDSTAGRTLVSDYLALPARGVLVLRLADTSPLTMHALETLSQAHGAPTAVEPGLTDETGTYLLYATGEIVVRFRQAQAPPDWLLEKGLWHVQRPALGAYAREALVIRPAADQPVDGVFAKAWDCQERSDVTCAYPVLLRGIGCTAPNELPPPWHIGVDVIKGAQDPSARVGRAWKASKGRGAVVGIVETGAIDQGHEALAGRIAGAWDVRQDPNGAPQQAPLQESETEHATQMSGFAVASEACPAPGVAPEALLLAVQRGCEGGALAEADALGLAASERASVVSCSWAPLLKNGVEVPIPPHSRWAIGWCLAHGGPKGTGAPVVFAAGNDGETGQSMNQNGYAQAPGVIAVGACDLQGARLPYSCTGDRLTCVFPTAGHPTGPPVPALDLAGPAGQNDAPSPDGDYMPLRNGGTSAACACVAGVLALLLARRPELTPKHVRELLIATCDALPDNVGGAHSPATGHGRVNAEAFLSKGLVDPPKGRAPMLTP